MKKIYLHLGTQKTGTTSLQSVLRKNQKLLKKNNLNYRPHKYCCSLLEKLKKHKFDPKLIHKEFNKTPHDVLISLENLIAETNLGSVKKIIEQAPNYDYHIIVYLRNSAEYVISMWAQSIKMNSHKYGKYSLEQFVEEFDYNKVLQEIFELSKIANVTLRAYDKSTMVNQNVIHDFLALFKLSISDGFSIPSGTKNISPSRNSTEIARILNCSVPDARKQPATHRNLLDFFLRDLQPADGIAPIIHTVPKELIKSICDQYQPMENKLAKQLLKQERLFNQAYPHSFYKKNRHVYKGLSHEDTIQACFVAFNYLNKGLLYKNYYYCRYYIKKWLKI